DFIAGTCLEDGSRQTNVIVKIALCLGDAKMAPEDGGGKIFRARLAVASGDRDDLQSQRSAIVGSQLLVGDERIVNAKQAGPRWHLAAPFCFHHCSDRAAPERLFNELMAIKVITAQGDEEIARSRRARIGADGTDNHPI